MFLRSAGGASLLLLSRKVCVLRMRLLVFPLWVWHVSSPLYSSKGLWEKGSFVPPAKLTLEPLAQWG